MSNDPKPMEPERLAAVREAMAIGGIPAPSHRACIGDLLADRDYQERRSCEAERDVDFLARLTGSAICRATCIEPGEVVVQRDAAIADHALTRAVENLRARAGQAESDYRFMVERTADQRLDGYRELGERAARAETERDVARAEVTRLRARVRVEAEDVERAGVMREQVEGWLAANGWRNSGRKYSDGTSCWVRGDGGTRVLACADAAQTVMTFADLAHIHERPGLDILDEMAAMPMEPSP